MNKYQDIPFEIERAKRISEGKERGQIITSEGEKVRIICWDRKGPNPIVALSDYSSDYEHLGTYTPKGTYFENETFPFPYLKLRVPI